MPAPLQVNWTLVEKVMLLGSSFSDAAQQFNIKENSIRKRARRCKWPLPEIIAKTKRDLESSEALLNQALITQHAATWQEKGEAHRQVAFDLAHTSLKKMKPIAPRNFRDAEAADKIARRAAGLENIEAISQTLINVNNLNDALPQEVIEAEIVRELPAGP